MIMNVILADVAGELTWADLQEVVKERKNLGWYESEDIQR